MKENGMAPPASGEDAAAAAASDTVADKAAVVAAGIALVRGERLLFRDLSFRIAPGEALLVVGRNGAGKSSLLRLLGGLLAVDEGALSNPFPTALLAAETALKPDCTVRDELRYWATLDGAGGGDLAARIAAAAASIAVEPLLPYRCGQLSSGQRQRVAIARLLLAGARLWLLDEPTNALDRASEERLLALIGEHRRGGGLVAIATHKELALEGARVLRL